MSSLMIADAGGSLATLGVAVGAFVAYLVAYHTYGRWLARRIFRLDPDAACPSVQLNDGRVSEAHALVSLRGRELRLLSLRGRFAVNGKTVGQVPLETGQTIFLAPGLAIEVLEVQLPESVLALEGEGIPRVVLSGVATVLAGPPVSVQSRYLPEGQAHIWSRHEWEAVDSRARS